jgi:phage shock protein PspC (stress-responsive transcriptional regulator)
MKKNFPVNIGKRLFNIDEDAFEILKSYLNRLRNFFAADEGREEILADIEMRIAELLEQKADSKGQGIVVLEYVLEVIREMGEPVQLSGETSSSAGNKTKPRGRLYRDPVNRHIGGVAAGLAAWFGMKPGEVRLIFLIFTLIYGIGPIVYAILWIILPEAQTTSEKLEMQRQNINIDNLRKELSMAGTGIQKTGSSFLGSLGSFLRNCFEIAARLIRWAFQLFGRLAGLLLLALVLLSYFGISLAFLVREDMGIGGYNFNSVTLYQVFQWMVPSTSDRWLFYIAFMLVLVALSGLLIYGGLRLLLKWPPLRWPVVLAFVLILFAGFFTAGSAIFRYSRSTDYLSSANEQNKLPMPHGNLHIKSGSWDVQKVFNPLTGDSVRKTGSSVLGEINFSFRPAPGDSLLVTLIRSASASNQSGAAEFSSRISYNYETADSLITINPYYSFPFEDGMHYQELSVIIGIPVNREVFIDREICWKVRYSDFIDCDNDGGLYLMSSSGLTKKKVEQPIADSTAIVR